jgi:hypothetical protein
VIYLDEKLKQTDQIIFKILAALLEKNIITMDEFSNAKPEVIVVKLMEYALEKIKAEGAEEKTEGDTKPEA